MFGIKKLHLLLLRSFMPPFIASFTIAMFILVLQFLSKYQNDVFGKGFGTAALFELFSYIAISISPLAFPIAIMIASLMALGKMGEQYELAGIKSAGISLFRTLYPLFVFGAGIGLLSFFISNNVVPKTNLKMWRMIYDASNTSPELSLKPGMFNGSLKEFNIWFGSRGPKGMMRDLKIWDHSEKRGNVKIIIADSGKVKMDQELVYLRLQLYHGSIYEELAPEQNRPLSYPFARTFFDSLNYKLDMSSLLAQKTPESAFANHQYMLNIYQLKHAIDSLDTLPGKIIEQVRGFNKPFFKIEEVFNEKKLPNSIPKLKNVMDWFKLEQRQMAIQQVKNNFNSIKNYIEYSENTYWQRHELLRRYEIELHAKFAFPTACLIMLFLGAPLGAIIRKGGLGAPTVVSLLLFVVFYTMQTFGRKMSMEDVVPVWVGIWAPIIIMSLMAFFVTYQSATDSKLFDLTAWKNLIQYNKLFKKKRSD